jgi:hypothetical protein
MVLPVSKDKTGGPQGPSPTKRAALARFRYLLDRRLGLQQRDELAHPCGVVRPGAR